MLIKYWGVRGSIPSPGAHTVRYGGDTSCISIEMDNRVIVIDAGTGIRNLGQTLVGSDKDIFCMFSHLHMDHVRGFAFFAPLYEASRPITLIPFSLGKRKWYPTELMDGIHFPRSWTSLPCFLNHDEGEASELFKSIGLSINTFQVNHPGGAVGFRIQHNKTVFAHVPDNEIDPKSDSYQKLIDDLAGVSILSHDGQFTEDDLPEKTGWGHSSISDLCQLAIDVGVSKLVIFHHDPCRTDDQLDAIGNEARLALIPHGIDCEVAYQGMTIDCRPAIDNTN